VAIGLEGLPRMRELVTVVFGTEEITPPGIVLEHDRPEWSIIKRERLWVLTKQLVASVGNFNKFLLQPTQGTDAISVLTHLMTDQDSFVSIGEQVVPAAVAGAFVVLRDGRRGLNARGVTRIFTKQEAALSSVDARFLVKANIYNAIPPFITSKGGIPTEGVILIESAAVNLTQNIYLAGYERIARKEELADL
jgi:hypothetical protein